MNDLLRLQSELQRHLLGEASAIAAHIADGPGIHAARRLGIYHHAYRARLAETLADTFGHLLRYLGPDTFDADARAFVETHPSCRPSLRWYGESFPAWLAARHPADGEIGELALLDWTLRAAFDGPDAAPLGLAALSADPPDVWTQRPLRLHPTSARLTLRFNALALWQALDDDRPPPPAAPLPAPGALLVWRRGEQPHFRSLGAAEALALDRVAGGASFEGVCAALAAAFPGADTVATAGTLLRRWIDEELLVA